VTNQNTSSAPATSGPRPLKWVSFVGSGPGDPGLLTVRAVELLVDAEIVITEVPDHEGLVRSVLGLPLIVEDDDADDRTVMEVASTRAVAPGETARFRVEWDALVPYGRPGRAGWVHDYHFIVQWFPKIGIFWNGAWNCHPFYAWTEFFADFGVYDVRLTLPKGMVELSPADLERVRRENAAVARLWKPRGPRQYALPLLPPLDPMPAGGRFEIALTDGMNARTVQARR